MKINIGMRILIGFSLLVIMLAVVGGVSYYNYNKNEELKRNILELNYPGVIAAKDVVEGTLKKGLNLRGFLLSGNETYYRNYQEAVKFTEEAVQQLYDLSYTDTGIEQAETIGRLNQQYDQAANDAFNLSRQGYNEEAFNILVARAIPLFTEMEVILVETSNFNKGQMTKMSNELYLHMENAKRITLIILAASVIIAIVLGSVIGRSITKPIGESVRIAEAIADGDLTSKVPDGYLRRKDEIGVLAHSYDRMLKNLRDFVSKSSRSATDTSSASEELAAIAEESSSVADQIAKSAQEANASVDMQVTAVQSTSATVEQISAGIQSVAANSDTAAQLSEKAVDTTKLGRESIRQAIKQMDSIGQASWGMKEALTKVTSSSKQINDIVGVINNISDQTNLLALNAAIEAARAGDAGRGFAVVAEEVRKLAEQTNEATQKIVDLINDNQTNIENANSAMEISEKGVQEGVNIVSTAGDKFEQIMELVNQVSDQIKDISASIEQIASGSQEIVSAVSEIDIGSKNVSEQVQNISSATEEQSAAMEEIASASQNLSRLAQEVQDIVNKFRI
ncbi:MAG: HAMP domain-containing protein [Clostridia bacterium]|nr:HAMP domain-containing protein [Clostridia bacterium]